ncbi:MAG: GTPase Era [Kiritimatiellae bacterium]|nr:GTPase Era [Kiritimatiellia bacterium]
MSEGDTSSGNSSASSGIVAVVGRANVGKSTLVNRILGEKVSVVSAVAQTTRNLVRGILSEPRGQLVFLDTPGVHKAEHDLGRLMNRTARRAVEGTDVVLLVLDGSSPVREEDEGWMRRLAKAGAACRVALNKTDAGHAHEAEYRRAWSALCAERGLASGAVAWHAVSGLAGTGVAELVAALFEAVPAGPALFGADVLTDFPRKLYIGDVIREKLFPLLHQELPHAVAVWIERLEEDGDRWQVDAVIYVNKPSQKSIVIGRKGRILKKARALAETELSAVYEKDVTLSLWVKVEEDWARKHWVLKRLGYI